MEQVYAWFDRRCRTQTALDKLTKLRRRLSRFKHLGETLKKLYLPTLEKALTFLDDKLLPSTSNAVERGNRRYRKMQKRGIRLRRDDLVSVMYSTELNSTLSLANPQRTDRDGILGQKPFGFQLFLP